MRKIKSKKIIAIVSILIILLTSLSEFVYASTQLNEAYLYKVEDCTTKLRYWSDKQNRWLDVICYYTEYVYNGNRYPAYCLNADFDRSRRIWCIYS